MSCASDAFHDLLAVFDTVSNFVMAVGASIAGYFAYKTWTAQSEQLEHSREQVNRSREANERERRAKSPDFKLSELSQRYDFAYKNGQYPFSEAVLKKFPQESEPLIKEWKCGNLPLFLPVYNTRDDIKLKDWKISCPEELEIENQVFMRRVDFRVGGYTTLKTENNFMFVCPPYPSARPLKILIKFETEDGFLDTQTYILQAVYAPGNMTIKFLRTDPESV